MKIEQLAIPILRRVNGSPLLVRGMNRLFAPLNPFDPRRYTDPYPLYERARREGGAFFFHGRAGGVWVATGFEECEAILRGPVSADRSADMKVLDPYSKMAMSDNELFTDTMLMTDPPDHGRLRTLVNRAFTPRAVAALEPQVEKITGELIDELRTKDGIEAMSAFADRMPIYVIADMIGLPQSERERLKDISDVAAKFIDPITGFDPAEMTAHLRDFESLLQELVAERLSLIHI